MVTPWSFSLSAQAYPGRTVAYFGLVTRNTSLVAKGTSVQNVTLPRPLVPYTQLQYLLTRASINRSGSNVLIRDVENGKMKGVPYRLAPRDLGVDAS